MEWDLIGHDWAAHILQKHIQTNNVRHAYLFSGSPGIGRRSLALQFAQAINCLQPPQPGFSCGTCRVCRQTAALQQPDLSILQVEEGKQEIRIEQVRELQRNLHLSPYEAKYRIALILNFQLANANAQNALLKTLEEAPPKVILLITTDAPENLFPTITSRCEILRLRPIPVIDMVPNLINKWQVDDAYAHELAHLSGGRFGLAKQYLENPDLVEQLHNWLLESFDLLNLDRVGRFGYVEKISEKRRKGETKDVIRQLLQTWLLLWRDILLIKSGTQMPLTYIQYQSWSRQVAQEISLEEIRSLICRMEVGLGQLESNVNNRLLLENIVLEWPDIKILH